MCYADDALPPLPPIRGAAASETDLELTAADGNRFAAFAARAAQPSGAGIVILPDVRGLHRFYKELAVRFAETGTDAIALDYFGRTAGIGERTDQFEWRQHTEQTTPATVAADVAACIDYLRSPEGGSATSIFTIGFCFGGGYAWVQGADQPGLAGAIGLYGDPGRLEAVADRLTCPVLMLVAGNDFRPVEAFEAARQRLEQASVPVEMHVYEGAPHSFFDRTAAEYQEQSQDAWHRMLDFISRNTKVPAPA